MIRLLFFLPILLLCSCNPSTSTRLSKTYPALDYREEVLVIPIAEETPPSAEVLGTVKIGDSGFSLKCDWNTVLERARQEVRKAGGNVLKITAHKSPNLMSTCHRIWGQILRIEDPEVLATIEESRKPQVDSTLDYAWLHVYRPRGQGSLITYDLHLGDTVLCKVKNKFWRSFQIRNPGPTRIWAKTETTVDLPLDIQLGREYYLRCSVKPGVMVGQPRLELIDAHIAKAELEVLKNRKK